MLLGTWFLEDRSIFHFCKEDVFDQINSDMIHFERVDLNRDFGRTCILAHDFKSEVENIIG